MPDDESTVTDPTDDQNTEAVNDFEREDKDKEDA